MANSDRNQAIGADESEKTRLVKRLRELATSIETVPKDVIAVVEELPDHPARADVLSKCYGVSRRNGKVILHTVDDSLRVSIRLLARLIESGAIDLGEHATWTDEDVAQEVLSWPETQQAFDTMRAQAWPETEQALEMMRAQGVTVDQQKVDELRASIEPTSIAAAKAVLEETRSAIEKVALDEELTETDADLLRALADDLSGSKHSLHRAAVARLYEIAERLDAEPAHDRLVERGTDERGTDIALHYIELEARVRVLEDEKLKNMVARGRIEQEVDNLVTGTAFMDSRVESCSGSIRDLEERLLNVEGQLVERYRELTEKLDSYTEKLWVCQQDVEKLEGCALTAEELATIRAGLTEEPAPVEEEATGLCAKCRHPLAEPTHKRLAPGGRPLTVCTAKGCNCETDDFLPEPQTQTSPCCSKCAELPVRFCGCACHDIFYGLEPRLPDAYCRRCGLVLEDCYCMGGPR